MEKITLGIEEIAKTKQAIDMLLRYPGIIFQKTYWLDRLRKNLVPPLKKWEGMAKEIFMKYAVEIPSEPFITPDKYQEFKKEAFDPIRPSALIQVFEKYETKSNHSGQWSIPVEFREKHNEEMKKAVEDFSKELNSPKSLSTLHFLRF